MDFTGNVVIGPDFFRKELRTYQNWPFAWGREIGQNSLDAGAQNIDIVIERIDESSCRITWKDDGCGMNEDILLGGYLVLGGSKKREGNAGGFGWAKTLILFAQRNYIIRTQDLLLTGCGGSFKLEKDKPFISGTEITVEIERDMVLMMAHIRRWLRRTDTKGCLVHINGGLAETFNPHRAIKTTKDIPDAPWAKMHVLHDKGKEVFFRINGQMMGSFSGADKQTNHIILDIEGDSTEYLTTNRDSIVWKYKTPIDNFLRSLYIDPNLVVRVKPRERIFKGKKGAIFPRDYDASVEDKLDRLLNNPSAMAEAAALMAERARDAVHNGHDIMLLNETNKSISERFVPGMMNKHGERLMTRWISIISLMGYLLKTRGEITPGWIFSTEAEAMCKGRAILLNPVKYENNGRTNNRFRLDNPGFNEMVAFCAHEFAHLYEGDYHDEDFAGRLTRIMRLVLDNWMMFKKLRREV